MPYFVVRWVESGPRYAAGLLILRVARYPTFGFASGQIRIRPHFHKINR